MAYLMVACLDIERVAQKVEMLVDKKDFWMADKLGNYLVLDLVPTWVV